MMGILRPKPIHLSETVVPPIPKPTRFENEGEKAYRRRVLEWMIDREVKN